MLYIKHISLAQKHLNLHPFMLNYNHLAEKVSEITKTTKNEVISFYV